MTRTKKMGEILYIRNQNFIIDEYIIQDQESTFTFIYKRRSYFADCQRIAYNKIFKGLKKRLYMVDRFNYAYNNASSINTLNVE